MLTADFSGSARVEDSREHSSGRFESADAGELMLTLDDWRARELVLVLTLIGERST